MQGPYLPAGLVQCFDDVCAYEACGAGDESEHGELQGGEWQVSSVQVCKCQSQSGDLTPDTATPDNSK